MAPLKHQILFVDDDPLILQGIRRSIEDYLDLWTPAYANSAEEALRKLLDQPFDAVVTDLLMPGTNGLQLLQEVSRRHPEVLRFVLSGNTKDAEVMGTTRIVHQMFPKPCSIERIFDSIEQACRLRDNLSDPNLIRIVTGVKTLPSLPLVFNQLQTELKKEEPSPREIGNIIAQDAAMTAKILQLVNSAFFGVAERISSPQRAVTILGIQTIQSLVLGIHIFSAYQGDLMQQARVNALWKHSLMVSVTARYIASELGLSVQTQGDAQIAGILHDIGRLLVLSLPESQIIPVGKLFPTLGTEYRSLGTSHAEIGAYLLGSWGLPVSIVEAVMLHHRPIEKSSTQPNITLAVHLANGLVNMAEDAPGKAYDLFFDMDYLTRMNVQQRLDKWEQHTVERMMQGVQAANS